MQQSEIGHRPSTSIRAIIFDLDDTLYPEREFAFSGFAAVSRAFAEVLGEPETAATRMRQLFNTEHRSHVFDQLLGEYGISSTAALLQRMIQTYRLHAPKITLFDDAQEMLTRLRPQYRLGLISDGLAEMQHAKIHALGLQDRLDEIIITSELGPGFEKPNPKAFELMAERLGFPGTACIYVADNAAKDFIAPNKLGWVTAQIWRENGVYRGQRAAPGGEAKFKIGSLYELGNLVG